MDFEKVMESYTGPISEQEGVREFLITTVCTVLDQSVQRRPRTQNGPRRKMSWLRESLWPWQTQREIEMEQRRLQETISFVSVTYLMSYGSNTENITDFDQDFLNFVTDNLADVTADLQEAGLTNITESEAPAQDVLRTDVPSSSPSVSFSPSASPTGALTESPSKSPSRMPTIPPSLPPISSTTSPAPSPEEGGSGGLGAGGIVGIILVIFFIAVGMGAYFFWRRRNRLKKEKKATLSTNGGSQSGAGFGSPAAEGNLGGAGSPADSIMSKGSLLSVGNSAEGYSDNEEDKRQHLADEFDEFRDQNLERMRTDIDHNLTGFDGMMSQAMTKALMDDDDVYVDRDELNWGGSSDNPLDIEASALYLVTQWLRQKKGAATVDERRDFMQQMLNKMVASVRHGVIGPDQGSQAIHECAAILDLELAVEIPITAIVVAGMRKTVNRNDMLDAFGEFGKIDYVSIASSSRGFGLVRFQSPSGVRKAIEKYQKDGEIVVQDVGVVVRELKSGEFGGRGSPPSVPGGPSVTSKNSPMGVDDPDVLRLD